MKEILLKNLLSTFSLAFFSILSILYSYYSGYNFGLMAYSRINTADVIGFSNILPLVFVLFGYTALVAFYPSDKGKIKSNLRVVLLYLYQPSKNVQHKILSCELILNCSSFIFVSTLKISNTLMSLL